MRSQKKYINEDGTSNLESSFLSCEEDAKLIIRKLFVESYPYSNELKRLLLINTSDCLDDRTNQKYIDKINNTSLTDMMDGQYIRLQPNLKMYENEEVKSYIVLSFDNFTTTTNNHYRDCIITIDVLCHIDCWDLGEYRQRPIKIMGYIDGILNNTKLTGIGRLEFMGANEMILSDTLAGYSLMYRAVHGDEDSSELITDELQAIYDEEDN